MTKITNDGTPPSPWPADAFERLRIAGDMLSNCAYNLAQTKGLPLSPRACQSLDECRKEWDAARDAVRAVEPGSRR